MLLRQLYRYNKWIFIFTITWLCAFVFLNVKWGMVASPIYQYGMFSEPLSIQTPRTAYRIHINDSILNPLSLSFAERDVLYVSLDKYIAFAHQNKKVANALRPFLPAFNDDDPRFFNSINDASFNNWYRNKIENILGKSIHTLEVFREQWNWQNNALKLHSSTKLAYFD